MCKECTDDVAGLTDTFERLLVMVRQSEPETKEAIRERGPAWAEFIDTSFTSEEAAMAALDKLVAAGELEPGEVEYWRQAMRLIHQAHDSQAEYDFAMNVGKLDQSILDAAMKAFVSHTEKIFMAHIHVHANHSVTPPEIRKTLGDEYYDSVDEQMRAYVQQSMSTRLLDQCAVIFDEPKFLQLIGSMMTFAFLQALINGFYAGSNGDQCFLCNNIPVTEDDIPARVMLVDAIRAMQEKGS